MCQNKSFVYVAIALLALLVLAGCSQNSAPDDATTVSFSRESGAVPAASVEVALSAPKGHTVAYTTDGREPTAADDSGQARVKVMLSSDEPSLLVQNRQLYEMPGIRTTRTFDGPGLPRGRVLRAALVDENGELGEVTTETYFLGTDLAKRFPGCLVVSVTTDPANLLDYEKGIMVLGARYDEWLENGGADELIDPNNWWKVEGNATQKGKEWERPCNLQIFSADGTPVAGLDAGMRITGGASRMFAQKSFNFYFREEYGSKWLDCELFEGIDRYRGFRMRGGGNNTMMLKFKDAYLLELLEGRACLAAQSRPAVLFLNGEYWGPYLLSEKISDQMIADHTGADKSQIVIMKEGEVDEGVDEDLRLYEDLMAFANRDLSDPGAWREFCEVMDVASFADYCAARIYLGDADWGPDANDILWRTRDDSYNGGRWQYVYYDVEFSTGMYGDGRTAFDTDHFQLALERYPLFAAAMRNDEFRELFVRSLEEIGGTDFAPEHAEAVLQTYLDAWEPLMDDCYARFGDFHQSWDQSIAQMREFFERRYDYIVPVVRDWRP